MNPAVSYSLFTNITCKDFLFTRYYEKNYLGTFTPRKKVQFILIFTNKVFNKFHINDLKHSTYRIKIFSQSTSANTELVLQN